MVPVERFTTLTLFSAGLASFFRITDIHGKSAVSHLRIRVQDLDRVTPINGFSQDVKVTAQGV